MKLARFLWNDKSIYGVIQGDQVLSIIGNIFDDFEVGDPLCSMEEVRFLPPTEPRSIVAMGINSQRRVNSTTVARMKFSTMAQLYSSSPPHQ